MADAAHDADGLRHFIERGLMATARITQNPTRAGHKSIDWSLDKKRHLVECFLNIIKHFRRIAP